MTKKRIAFGIGLGILLGLLADGFLLIHTSGWMAYLVFPVVLPPLVGGVIGGIVGWKLRTPSPPWSVIAATVLLCPISVWGPIKFQEIRFRWFAESLPVFPKSERQITWISPLGGDSPPGVSVVFRSTANAEKLVGYYRNCLIERGWHPTSMGDNVLEWQLFRKGRYSINMIGFNSDQGGEYNKYTSVNITRRYNTSFYR